MPSSLAGVENFSFLEPNKVTAQILPGDERHKGSKACDRYNHILPEFLFDDWFREATPYINLYDMEPMSQRNRKYLM
jgi:hypothetical protein